MINTTNDPSTPPTQRSIGELVQSIRDELLGVVHHEIDIAKKEVTALGIKIGIIAPGRGAAVPPALRLGAAVRGRHRPEALGPPPGARSSSSPECSSCSARSSAVALLVEEAEGPGHDRDRQAAVQAVQGKRRQNAVSYDDTFEELYGKQVSARTD